MTALVTGAAAVSLPKRILVPATAAVLHQSCSRGDG
jgi:hypothetical protein